MKNMDRLNQTTAVSKVVAAVVFIALPFLGFWLGFNYQNELNEMYKVCLEAAPTIGQ